MPSRTPVGVVAEAVDELGIELSAAAISRYSDGRRDAAGMVEGLDAVGQADESAGHRQLLAPGFARHPLAVPTLERLQERRSDLRAKTKPVSEIPRRLTVGLHDRLHRAPGSGHESADQANPPQGWASSTKMPRYEDAHGHPSQSRRRGYRQTGPLRHRTTR